jgi:hypothetical protein
MALAWRLLEGKGYPKHEREAFRWYSAALEGRDERAYLRLAELYADGRGTERNAVEAYALVEIADAVVDPISDSHQVPKIRELKALLESELQADQIAQALRRAEEIRPGVTELRANQKTMGFFFDATFWTIVSIIVVFAGRFIVWEVRALRFEEQRRIAMLLDRQ